MKQKRVYLSVIMPFFLLIVLLWPGQSDSGNYAGKIVKIDYKKNHVYVRHAGTAPFHMGQIVMLKHKNRIIKLRAVFPMMTMSRCRVISPKWWYVRYLRKNMRVYYRVTLKKPADTKNDAVADLKKKTIGGMDFVYLKGGSFMMGSKNGGSDEKPVHKVTLSGFYMGKYEVTQKQYKAIMGKNPSRFKGKPNNPVEKVSWHDAMEFCKRFSKKYGVKASLPTEAQWEYACRAGTTTKYYWGDSSDFSVVNQYAVYDKNSYDKGSSHKDYGTHQVGTKKPNAFGLYDMSGNVWEWCLDWYDKKYYAKSPEKDPVNTKGASYRVLRGGSWDDDSSYLRSADRFNYTPDSRLNFLGFRLMLRP